MNEEKGKEVVNEYGEDNVIFTKTDVTDSEQVRIAIENTYNKFGALHITLNSAGIMGITHTLTSKTMLDFKLHRKQMDINVNGTIYSSAYSAFYMAKNKEVNDRGEKGKLIDFLFKDF